jgi:hypothetical protein
MTAQMKVLHSPNRPTTDDDTKGESRMKTIAVVIACALALSNPLEAQQRDSAVAVPMKPAAVTRGWPNDSTKRDDLRSDDMPDLSRMQLVGASLVLAATIADVTGLVPLRGPAPQRKLNIPLTGVFFSGVALIVGGMGRRVWTERPSRLTPFGR